MADKISFGNNVPVTVTFKFPKPIDPKPNPEHPEWSPNWYYGVTLNGQDAGFGATEYLHTTIQTAKATKGSVVTICKHLIPDGDGRVYWTCEVDGTEYDSRALDIDAPQPTSKPQSHDLQKPGFNPKAHMDYMQYLCDGMRRRLPDWTTEDARATAISIYIGTPNGCHSAPAEDDLPF